MSTKPIEKAYQKGYRKGFRDGQKDEKQKVKKVFTPPKEGDFITLRGVACDYGPLEVVALRLAPSRVCMILCHNGIADNHFTAESISISYFWKKFKPYEKPDEQQTNRRLDSDIHRKEVLPAGPGY